MIVALLLQTQPATTIDRESFLFVCFLTCKQEDPNIVHDGRKGRGEEEKKEEKCKLKCGHWITSIVFEDKNAHGTFRQRFKNYAK